MIYTQRIFWPQYNSREKLDHLLSFLGSHRATSDEISFFTEGDGMDWRYLPPDEVTKRAEFLSEAVQIARNAGFVPVINILNTMGHSDEGGPEASTVPWQGIAGMDGAQARQCSCPADPSFLDYVRFKYEQFAHCKADRYWIDDDLRMENHNPAGWGCFCPQCLADFSKRTGICFTRPALVEVLRTNRSLRKAWVQRNGEVMLGVLSACAEGVRRGHPGAEIGLMTCDVLGLADAGVDFHQWFNELSRIAGGRAWLRPGGGFWSDESPRALLGKVHSVANTIDRLPPGVRAAYEVENYPFMVGAKSATITGLECLLAVLATRLDGIMFDTLDMAGNNPSPYGPWLGQLETWRPLWDEASKLIGDTLPVGWRPTYSLHHFQQNMEERSPTEMLVPDYKRACGIQLAGLPFTGFSDGAAGHLLAGEAVRGMSKEELTALLDKPLIMDGESAARFVALGMGERIGIRGIETRSEGAFETFTNHDLNGSNAGHVRVVTMKYFGLQSYILTPNAGTESLSLLMSYSGEALGSALTLYRPENGSPVAVLGHIPWSHALSPQRMAQLRGLAFSMLGEIVPITIEANQAVAFWYRQSADSSRRFAVLFNSGFDTATVRLVASSGGLPVTTLALATPGVVIAQNAELTLPGWGVAVVALS